MDNSKRAQQLQEALIDQKDYIREIVNRILQSTLEGEFDRFIGAKLYERTDERNGYRNGYYTRQLKTRVGTLMLHVCRDRDGEFQPELFARYQRNEKALVLTVMEMYIAGVATRKVTQVMEELCGTSISKSQVSTLVCQLDSDVEKWRNRRLEEEYVYLIFDARYEKVRENGYVVSKAFVVAIGITKKGKREVIGCWVINSESFEAWDACFQSLKERGLKGVEYIVTDENKGLRKALQKYYQDVKVQRCQVHFMRNFLGKLSKSDQPAAIKLLQEVFAAESKEEALERLNKVKDYLTSRKKEQIVQWLEENIEETLVVLTLPAEHRKKMKSTNMLERLNQELKRRSRVVRIFPNGNSCLRLLSSLCENISESWEGRAYLNMNI